MSNVDDTSAATCYRRRVACLMCLIVLIWLLLGMLIFHAANNCSELNACVDGELVTTQQCGWTWAESFYYSVQTGFSVGFGLLSESNDGSRIYAVIHLLLGSSIITGILAVFVAAAVNRHTGYEGRAEEALAAYSERMNVDGYSGFTADQLKRLLCRYKVLYQDLLEKVETRDDEVERQMKQYVAFPPSRRGALVSSLLKKAFESVDEMKGGKLSIEDIMKLHAQESSRLATGWRWVQEYLQTIILFGAFVFWLLIGVVYGLTVEDWGFIQSMYFSVSTLSTGGLQAVSRTDSQVLFAAFFVLTGVPLYAAALGSFANAVVDLHSQQVAHGKLNSRLDAAEVSFVEHLLALGQSDTLTLAEFTEVELLNLGAVDRDTLEQIKRRFRELDKDGRGTLSKSEVMKTRSRKIARVTKRRAGMQDSSGV